MRTVTKENLIAQIERLYKIKDEQGQLSMSGEYTLLATMEAEPVIVVGDDGGDALSYRRLIQSFAPGTKLYIHTQPDTNHLSRVCAESYQVVSALAEALRIFNDIGVIKALDNLSAQELIHDDVLPFLVPEAAQPAPVVPDEKDKTVDADDHPLLWSFNEGWNACRAAMLNQK